MNVDNMNMLEATVKSYNETKAKFLAVSSELSDAIAPLYKKICYEQGTEIAIDWLYSNVPDSVARVIAINVCLKAEDKELLPNSSEMQTHLQYTPT